MTLFSTSELALVAKNQQFKGRPKDQKTQQVASTKLGWTASPSFDAAVRSLASSLLDGAVSQLQEAGLNSEKGLLEVEIRGFY